MELAILVCAPHEFESNHKGHNSVSACWSDILRAVKHAKEYYGFRQTY
jgi:hypothetical protein